MADNGHLVIATDEILTDIKTVQYFSDQKLFVLVFDNGEDQLMSYEVSDTVHPRVIEAPKEIIIAQTAPSGGSTHKKYLARLEIL